MLCGLASTTSICLTSQICGKTTGATGLRCSDRKSFRDGAIPKPDSSAKFPHALPDGVSGHKP